MSLLNLYDICVSAEQLQAAAAWAESSGPDVLLFADDVLVAHQGDEWAAFDAGGTKVDEGRRANPLREREPTNREMRAQIKAALEGGSNAEHDALAAVAARFGITWSALDREMRAQIKDALEGESNDAEHGALAAVAARFGITWSRGPSS